MPLLFIPEPLFTKLQEHCLSKLGAFEDHPWDQVAFKVAPMGKAFCFCSGAYPSITVKSTHEKQAALIQHPSIEIAPYLGHRGWVTIQIRDEEELSLALELVEESYELVTAKKRTRNG